MQSALGKNQEHQHRQTRLADGREAVRLGTESQRLYIIKRFEEEIRQTPQRKRLYQEAIDRAMSDGVKLEISGNNVKGNKPSSMKDQDTTVDPHQAKVSSSPQAIEEDDDVVFAREIELAKELSLGTANVM